MVLGRLASLGPFKLAVIAIAGLGLTIGGAFAVGILGTPDVADVDNSFGDVNESTTIIETDLVVHNPNPFGASIGDVSIDYEITMNEIPMATGGREGVEVDRGNSSLSFTNEMDNDRLPDWWVSHLQNDEVTTLEIHADVHAGLINRTFTAPTVERPIETDIIEAFNSAEDRELNADSPVIQDPVLIVRETRGEWGDVDEAETEIEMEFDIHNPRTYPITVTEIGYEIRMNGIEMGEGETEQGYVIPPGGTETVEATTRMNNQHLNDWWVSHLENDQVTHLEVDFWLRVDLSDAGGDTVTIPLDTMEQTIETDIFDEKDGDETRSDSTGADDETDDDVSPTPDGDTTPTPTPDDDATPTPTPDETETPTPTPSDDEDDDDLLDL